MHIPPSPPSQHTHTYTHTHKHSRLVIKVELLRTGGWRLIESAGIFAVPRRHACSFIFCFEWQKNLEGAAHPTPSPKPHHPWEQVSIAGICNSNLAKQDWIINSTQKKTKKRAHSLTFWDPTPPKHFSSASTTVFFSESRLFMSCILNNSVDFLK